MTPRTDNDYGIKRLRMYFRGIRRPWGALAVTCWAVSGREG